MGSEQDSKGNESTRSDPERPARSRHARLTALVAGALARTGPERFAWLDEACVGGDEALRAEVDAMLARADGDGKRDADGLAAFAGREAAELMNERSGESGGPGAATPGPRRVGPYRVEGVLGRGGMGVVYRAFDERLHREVALKALPDELVGDGALLARLELEARALALVSHPNVAMIFGMESADASRYLVLELVPGETLRDRLDRRTPTVEVALGLCRQVAEGLTAVHAKGLVHRDLKPGNVMVTPDGVAKLLDFGIARMAREGKRGELTRRGEVLGTPGWMSPEQLRGEELDARSDAWAWGCLLFECLAGAPAFPGETWTDREAATLRDEPDWRLLPAEVPEGARELLHECLSKDRSGRPASLAIVGRRLSAEATPSLRSRGLPRHALPAERDEFVGRARELDELGHLFDEGHRLVSVLGVGGTGKTRLALHFARLRAADWPGGAWFCDLSEARSVSGIVTAVAAGLSVPLGKDDPVAQLGHAIAGRGRCLIVLDNFEQVARHAEETLGSWLDHCEQAAFLVTTREVLGLPGEQAHALTPLGAAEGAALFGKRAAAARRGAAPGDDEPAIVTRLVQLLDGLPLAIELAAARVRVMTPAQLLERMGDRFRLLASGGGRRDRQATLQATLDWSWDLLTDWERTALAQTSVFEGGFTLEAAEAVLDLSACGEAPWTVDVVQALVDKSLVRRVDGERFDLLVSVQQYAAGKLRAPGACAGGGADAAVAAELRHGEHFARHGADEALRELFGPRAALRRRELEAELDNLLAAGRRAIVRQDEAVAAAALQASWGVLQLRGPLATAIDMARAVTRMPALASRARAQAYRVLGDACRHAGLGAEAGASLEEGVSLAREIGDRGLEESLVDQLALVDWSCGRLEAARERWNAALAEGRQSADRAREMHAMGSLGNLHSEQGRFDESRACSEAALALSRELGHRTYEGAVLGNLGLLHDMCGRRDEARACLESALAIAREVGDRRGEGAILCNLGIHHLGRDSERARAELEAALAMARSSGQRRDEGIALANLVVVHRSLGDLDEARRIIEPALANSRETGNRRFEGFLLGNLGKLHAEAGRFDDARAALDDGEAILRSMGEKQQLGQLLCHRITVERLAGNLTAARAACAEAEGLVTELGVGPESWLGGLVARARASLEESPA